jgi:hypothetical protein
MQYVAVRFQPGQSRTYTYHNEGEPVAPGDWVKVETKDGWKQVEVVEIVDEKPPFATKPVIERVAPPKPVDAEFDDVEND